MKAPREPKRQITKGLEVEQAFESKLILERKNERPGALTALKQLHPGRSRRPYVFAFLIA
jgi:hypothetical protein